MKTTSTTTLEAADVKTITDGVVAAIKPLIPTAAQVAAEIAKTLTPATIADAIWKRALSPVTSPTDNAASWVRRAALAAESEIVDVQTQGLTSDALTAIVTKAVKDALGVK